MSAPKVDRKPDDTRTGVLPAGEPKPPPGV
jgi:hypothetical protein